MLILVTNDDGLGAPGIEMLERIARGYGDVYVIAPKHQCSAMSQRVTLGRPFDITFESEEAAGEKGGSVKRYSVDGTPADCVRVALRYIMKERPDYVFSGINHGYNSGFDVAYSGTIAAAIEGTLAGVPAIAFSSGFENNFEACRYFLPLVIDYILEKAPACDYIWNVNVPQIDPLQINGILYGRTVAQQPYYDDEYLPESINGNVTTVLAHGLMAKDAPEGTDIAAIFANYVSVGKVKGTAHNPMSEL